MKRTYAVRTSSRERGHRIAALILTSIGILVPPGVAWPAEPVAVEAADQDSAQGTKAAETQAPKPAADATSTEKKGEWLIAPIPISSPAVGSGLAWGVARVFPLSKNDNDSPPSIVGVGGVFTNNGTRAIAFGGHLYMKEDKYRMTAGVGKASVNADIYGIGLAAGRTGIFVPLNVSGTGFMGEFLRRVHKGVYLGVRGQFRNLTLGLNQERLDEQPPQPPDQVQDVIDQIRENFLEQRTVSLGPRFQWDTRDNVYYPGKGLLTEVTSDFFSTGLGSKFTYQRYTVAFNKYNRISDHQIIAFRGMGCAASGDRVPIYDLCLFGTMNDLRGYAGGQFQDRRMFATQAEYRLMLPFDGFMGRFGLVAFGGVGAIADKFSNLEAGNLLPGGGGGVRFRLLKKSPINFRVDVGFGKEGHTVAIGVMEAF